jgi:hypothetical protein
MVRNNLMQLKADPPNRRILQNQSILETVMPEPLQDEMSAVEPTANDAAARFTRANRTALELLFGAQKILLEEMVFGGNEILDRARTETHLLSEFISKMAGSHSVRDWKTMLRECSQHQIDFLRRDSERVFRHGQRMRETVANLLANRPQPS